MNTELSFSLCSHGNQPLRYVRLHQFLQDSNQSSNSGDTRYTLLFHLVGRVFKFKTNLVAMFYLIINLLLLQVSILAGQQSKLSLIYLLIINCNIIYSVYRFVLADSSNSRWYNWSEVSQRTYGNMLSSNRW